MNKILAQLMEKRGLLADYLAPKYEELADPEGLPDMRKAAERLVLAAERGEKVLIYGDYDADGVTATAVMHDTLELLGVREILMMLPDRVRDGYGMSERLAERAVNEGVKLVVTVDCGSRNGEIIDRLAAAGIETVVTDHHECGAELPKAVAVVNPKRRDGAVRRGSSGRDEDGDGAVGRQEAQRDEDGDGVVDAETTVPKGLRGLAGVGVAFMVARESVKMGKIPAGQEKWLLDLVLIGTICDSMVLRGENRRLCYWGKVVLEKTRRPGLQELMKSCKIRTARGEDVGFRIGPRINAAGRLESAELALRLILTKNRAEAARLAKELDDLNARRREIQVAAGREIAERGIDEQQPVMVVVGDWHEGVLGIIAGKLVEKYQKPAWVLTRVGGVQGGEVQVDLQGKTSANDVQMRGGQPEQQVFYKGSGRSFGEFNLAAALAACEEEIVGGGGHAEAAGVRVAGDKLADFTEAMNGYYRSLKLTDQERFLRVGEDVRLRELGDLTVKLMDELGQLEPFGMGNEEPIFLLMGMEVVEVRRMGAEQQHLMLVVRDRGGKTLKLVAFGAPQKWLKIGVGAVVNAWVRLSVDEWQGQKLVEGMVEDLGVVS